MRASIVKLNNTNICPKLIYIFYNIYLIKSIYFGTRIMRLSVKQKNELIKIAKPAILQKLGLSLKFL